MKQNSKENIYSLTGLGHVFRFTLIQTLKNKTFLITAIMMILIMSLMKPISYLMSKGESSALTSASLKNIEASKMYILNETDFELSKMDVAPEANLPADSLHAENVEISSKGEAKEEDLISALSAKDILVIIRPEAMQYKVNAIISDNSEVSIRSVDNAADYVYRIFSDARKHQMDLDDAAINAIASGVGHNSVLSEKEYQNVKEETMTSNEYMSATMAFGFVVFIVTTMAISFIIVSVNEEKVSKLAESLLVSVRPMALMMGKVLGMLCYVAGIILLGVLGSFIAERVMISSGADMSNLQNGGINLAIYTSYGFAAGILLIVETLLALGTFGIFGGIMGAACSKTEDQQSANTVVMMIVMAGFLGSMYLGTKSNLTIVGALLPPFSFFTAPIAYVGGKISLAVMVGSLTIQVALLDYLVMLAAKTYRSLLLTDSTTPKLKTIFAATKM